MNVALRIKEVGMSLAKGIATRRSAKLVVTLALGAVLLGGTALHFAPDRGDEMPARTLREEIQSIPDNVRVQGSPHVDAFRADESASPGYRAWVERFEEETVAMNLLTVEARTSDEAAFLLDEVNDGAITGVQAWQQYVRTWAERYQEEKVATNLLTLEARTSDEAAFLLDEVNDGAITGVQAWQEYVRSTKASSLESSNSAKVSEALLTRRLDRWIDSLPAEAALDPRGIHHN